MVYKAVGMKRELPWGGSVVHLVATSDSPAGPFFVKHPPHYPTTGAGQDGITEEMSRLATLATLASGLGQVAVPGNLSYSATLDSRTVPKRNSNTSMEN